MAPPFLPSLFCFLFPVSPFIFPLSFFIVPLSSFLFPLSSLFVRVALAPRTSAQASLALREYGHVVSACRWGISVEPGEFSPLSLSVGRAVGSVDLVAC